MASDTPKIIKSLTDDDLQKHVIQMYPNRKIHYFIDPVTGLPSVNHFVLY